MAARVLEAKGISCEVINIHTIKPLDAPMLLTSIQKTGCVVVAEEHQKLGIKWRSRSLLAENKPTPIEFVAVNDKFGESGTPAQLMQKYGLSSEKIVEAVEKVIKRK